MKTNKPKKKKQTYDSFGKPMAVKKKLAILKRYCLTSYLDREGKERIVRRMQ